MSAPARLAHLGGGNAIGAFLTRYTTLVAYAVLVLILVVADVLVPGFVSYNHLSLLLSLAAILGIVAAGQTIVILTGSGGIDLSVSGMISLASVTLTGVSNGVDSRFPEALMVILGIGIVVGLINGIGIAFLRLPPLVMTLGMGGILSGATLVSTNGTPSGSAPPLSVTMATGQTILNLPIGVLIWAGIAIVLIVLLRRTILGRQIYAIGTNRRVSQLSGINITALLLGVYVLSAVLAAFAGILVTGQNGTGNTTIGDNYLLPSVAAVVIGGTSIVGGKGGYAGTIAGAIIIVVLQALLQAKGISAAGQDVLYGIVILAVLFAYGREQTKRA